MGSDAKARAPWRPQTLFGAHHRLFSLSIHFYPASGVLYCHCPVCRASSGVHVLEPFSVLDFLFFSSRLPFMVFLAT